jgi:hypothetical protein
MLERGVLPDLQIGIIDPTSRLKFWFSLRISKASKAFTRMA